MRIPNEWHKELPWSVHELTPDFALEDVWRFPIEAGPEHNLTLFREKVLPRIAHGLTRKGIAGLLFRLRWLLGKIFRWDPKTLADPPNQIEEKSLRRRYLEKGGESEPIPRTPRSKTPFSFVYIKENEYLAEITNKTVFAAIHYSWTPIGEDRFAVDMAVYVKPNGRFGRMYMAMIRPFRRLIVYPKMMKLGQQAWRDYLSGKMNE